MFLPRKVVYAGWAEQSRCFLKSPHSNIFVRFHCLKYIEDKIFILRLDIKTKNFSHIKFKAEGEECICIERV